MEIISIYNHIKEDVEMGRWTCTIIQNTELGRYRVADFRINGKEVNVTFSDFSYYRYVDLRALIRIKTGIDILKRKDMIFERLSDFEKIATIDNTQVREDCRVTIKERIAGWQPCFD